MALKFRIVERVNKLDKEHPKTYYFAKQMPTDSITVDDLAEEVAHATTLRPFEVKGVLEELQHAVIMNARKGFRVSLGEIGVIQPQIRAKGVESRDEFEVGKHIKGVYPRFNPSRALRDAFASCSVSEVSPCEKGKDPDKKKDPDHPAFDDPSKPKPEDGNSGNAD